MARTRATITAGNKTMRATTVLAMMRAAAFRRGFEDVKRGRPFALDAFDIDNHWQYERGRQFACIFDGQLKVGRRVTRAAHEAYCAARKAKIIL